MARPIILVSRPNSPKDKNYKRFKFIITMLGGRAIRITSSKNTKIDVNTCDGLILTGGRDIHPSHYGEKEHAKAKRHHPNRDTLEIKLFKEFKKQGKPIFGVCRGMQMINVCLGGTLYQHIGDHFEDTNYPKKKPQKYFFRKPTNIEKDTVLYDLFQKEQIQINSLHHQAVKELGKNLRVTAREPKGIIQGIEHKKTKNIFGVQWHPEIMRLNLDQWKLFHHFIKLCKYKK